MDQLFLMQRYWGSDEEDNKEDNSSKFESFEKPESSNEKQKSSILLVDLDNDDYVIPNKKQKLDSSAYDSDLEIVIDTNPSQSEEKLSGMINVPINITSKKQRSKNANLQKKDREMSPEKNYLTSIDNTDYSLENIKLNECSQGEVIDNKSNLKKEKKQSQRYFDLDESDHDFLSIECDLLNNAKNNSKSKSIKKINEEKICNSDKYAAVQQEHDSQTYSYKNKKQSFRYFDLPEINNESMEEAQLNKKEEIFSPKNKRKKTSLHETVNVTNKVKSENIKKLRPKHEEFDKSCTDNVLGENNINSEDSDKAFPTIGQTYLSRDVKVKHTLPQWLSNPTYISVNLQEKEIPISELEYLDLNSKTNLINTGINYLFPVQLAVIPWLMQSKEQSLLIRPSDICVSAPTGSGKTLAFVLPIVQSLKDRVVCAIRALVVLPVSELAIQVYKVFETYIQGTDLKVALLTGKKSFIAEQNFLVKSTSRSIQSLVDIVVATPGRIHDHIYRTQGFCLKRLRYLVIDEADRMMEEIEQGWLKEVEDAVFHDCISSNCICSSYKRTYFEPTSAYNFGFISQPLQKLLYSATLTHDPEQLHTLSLYKPKLFTASAISSKKEYKGSCAIPPELKMFQVTCEESIKPMVICHLIKQYNFKRVLCFTQTVERAHRLHLVLEEMGLLQVREISSFNRPQQRKIVLGQFCSGKINVLVCSDLVARGIDVKDIDCVISYDIPQKDQIFIHRIGRTARAGKTGTAIAFVSEGEVPYFKKMINSNPGIKLPERISINSEDLEPLVKSFQHALSIADAKLKKEKSQSPRKSSKKIKKK